MTPWIPYPTTLTGDAVQLVSLLREHFPALEELAQDSRIWEHYTFDGTDSKRFREILEMGLSERERGTQFPFVITLRASDAINGSTRFLDIQFRHRKLEIGSTWLHPDYWGTDVNRECKLLLLTYCFETLKTVRVQLKTDERNERSRKAIEKIGGQFEGILRNDMLRDNGMRRNSAYYSLTEEEWVDKKKRLMEWPQKKVR
jgi:N-acetyltransferase